MRRVILYLLIIFTFTNCSKEDRVIKIAVSSFSGYAPLFYAYEKGWIGENIKIMPVTSLSQSLELYEVGLVDGFCGTQKEYFHLTKNSFKLSTVIPLTYSMEADVILSNYSLEELKYASEVDVYLEVGSVNEMLFKEFMKQYNLKGYLNIINQQQNVTATTKLNDKPTIIVTYEPFASKLKANGFKQISSSKDLNLTIFDLLFLDTKTLKYNKEELIELKKEVEKAIVVLEKNPQEFFKVVNSYFEEQTFESFMKSLTTIKWIDKDKSKDTKRILESLKIEVRDMI